jgi:hypothetical protein
MCEICDFVNIAVDDSNVAAMEFLIHVARVKSGCCMFPIFMFIHDFNVAATSLYGSC